MSIVNVETGEIIEPRESQEAGAIAMLAQAISSLTAAVDAMPIGEVVSLKAKVATIATATRELGMSKDARELADEAVRRSEWALGRAVRKGQSEGYIATHGQSSSHLKSALDFGSRGAMYGGTGTDGLLGLADAIPDAAALDAAIDGAKAEGNLSRANVARKARERSGVPHRATPADNPGRETTLINDIRLYLQTMSTSKEIRALTPEGRAHIITALNNAATHIQEI